MTRKNKIPSWAKGALVGFTSYSIFSLTLYIIVKIGAPLFDKIEWLSTIILPALFMSIYPGFIFTNNYEALQLIIPINLAFYSVIGALIAKNKIHKKLKILLQN